MGNELIGDDGGVGFDFDQVDCHGRDLGQHGAAEGVGECEVNGVEAKVDAKWFGLV